jgi:anthranilate synthase/phosphoribosyltransferase
MKTLILDNYDSFTFNLYQAVAELGGDPVVHRNDALSIDDVRKLKPVNVIISPGPGNPYEKRDIGISEELVKYAEVERIPLLGVCLGHQVLSKHFGATVDRAPKPFHGKASLVAIDDRSNLFRELPNVIEVMRYHSLCAREETIPHDLRVIARTDDGIVMAIEHATLPLYGVQFHPESIGTPSGKTILKNFLGMKKNVDRTDPEIEELFSELFSEATSEQKRAELFRRIIALPITPESLAGAAQALRDRMLRVELPGNPVDTCGTGGSGKRTINTSTLSAFLVAASGGYVAKHGNRSASGNCGSFDLLEHLGVNVMLSPEAERRMYDALGIVFLFAPLHHPAMRLAAPLRKQHGRKTLFNLVGPLCSPASVRHQLLGTGNADDAKLLCDAMMLLGTLKSFVVMGLDGLDEISPCAPSIVYELPSGRKTYFSPSDLGLSAARTSEIEGGSPEDNVKIFLELSRGGGNEALRRLVILNASHALLLSGRASTLADAYDLARETLLLGKVHDLFLRYRDLSHRLS